MGTSLYTPSLRALTADSEICFVADDGSGKELKLIPSHAFVLARASEYFNALLDFNLKSGASTTGHGHGCLVSARNMSATGTDGAADANNVPPPVKKARRELLMRFVVPIPEDSLTQAEALVEFMYSGTLTLPATDTAGARGMLQAAALADAWRLPTCVKQCVEELTTLSKGETLDLEAVVPTLPDSITAMSEFKEFLHTNYEPTLQPFLHEADGLVTCKGERSQQFCALSPLLIKLWADSDIKARSEGGAVACGETVVLLITRWWLAQTPAIQQDEDLCLALSHALKVCGLSSVYLTSVLPTLPWFRGAKTEAYIEILNRKLLGSAIAKSMPEAGLPGNWGKGGARVPRTWQKWDLPTGLAEPLPPRFDLPARYGCGFMWSARISIRPGNKKPRVHVMVASPLEELKPHLEVALRRLRATLFISLKDSTGEDFSDSPMSIEVQGTSAGGEVIGSDELFLDRDDFINEGIEDDGDYWMVLCVKVRLP